MMEGYCRMYNDDDDVDSYCSYYSFHSVVSIWSNYHPHRDSSWSSENVERVGVIETRNVSMVIRDCGDNCSDRRERVAVREIWRVGEWTMRPSRTEKYYWYCVVSAEFFHWKVTDNSQSIH
jgi:hypothetical protein